jgi:hypothetical protein
MALEKRAAILGTAPESANENSRHIADRPFPGGHPQAFEQFQFNVSERAVLFPG